MTKIGRKGFMLAEVVVVAVVIGVVLVTLYTGLSKVSSAYEIRNRYYDVDSLYVAMEINNTILRNDISLNGIITEANSVYNWASNLTSIDENNIEKFETLYAERTNNKIYSYITPYNKSKMLSLKNINTHGTKDTFSDYLNYLSTNLNFNDDYNYMIIVERIENNDIDDYYYYALKLKY